MLTFILRRLVAAFFVVLGATFIMYILVSNAGNPLESANQISDPTQRQQRIVQLTTLLHLDVNVFARYFIWLKGVAGCFVGSCDFGVNVALQPVSAELGGAMLTTLRLVSSAFVLAIVIGIVIGIVTALRQYSGLDYTVTFMTFVFFSLPVFWIGILLKDLVAIRYNDFLQEGAYLPYAVIIGVALLLALLAWSTFQGPLKRRLLIAGGVGVAAFGAGYYVSYTQWLLDPGLGFVLIAIIAVLLAFGTTSIMTGLANKKALYSALTTAGVGIALWYPLQFFFYEDMSFLKLALLAVLGILVGLGVGWLFGGDDRWLSARNGAVTALLVSVVVFLDRLMQAWSAYSDNPAIRGRPLATTSPTTPNLQGDFWIQTTDIFTHLLLPTLTLMLISLATYSRYTRASMLEVLNQDYIRTARAKGLTERTVVVRHAFRNALIPLTTIIALDVGAVIGGAVLTETVFGWRAMGVMFQTGLLERDPNPVMAFALVVALFAVSFNIIADLVYAALDPRIRLTS